MNAKRILAAACCCLATFGAGAQQAADTSSWEGLVPVKPKRLDAAYLLPGADFRPYRKLILEPATVAFRKDWMRRMNSSAVISERVTQQDAERIAAAARQAFTEVFADAFRNAGYEIVAAPGADVLRVRAGVIDLYLTAPDAGGSGRSRTFTMEAGEATLFLEARDSTSGAILGRALDQRATRNTGRLSIANEATNQAELRALFHQWAEISVKGLENLRALSPVPEDLKPGQKLGS